MMMKTTFVVAALLVGGVAMAQPKDDQKTKDAQAKVDAAKTETCEKGKKFLADQKAKGKCAAEADEAAKVTCSATTFKQMNDLMTKCTSAKPADKPAAGSGSAADKPAEPAGVPKCRAIDADGKTVIDEAEDKLTTKCSTLLLDKLKKKWCTAENKGKKFDYTLQFDHVVGKGATAKKMADSKRTWTCRTVAK
jgi:hypothetical protein